MVLPRLGPERVWADRVMARWLWHSQDLDLETFLANDDIRTGYHLMRWMEEGPAELQDPCRRLLERLNCKLVLVTLSEHGMMLFQPDAPPYHTPTRAQEVFDVSGAGDTAIAAFTAALAGGATPVEAAEISNHAAGIVVGKLGTAIVSRAELLSSFPA